MKIVIEFELPASEFVYATSSRAAVQDAVLAMIRGETPWPDGIMQSVKITPTFDETSVSL